MAKPININLFDQKSIQAAVKAIRDYENSLTYKCRLLAEKLAKKGIEVARMQVTSLDAIFTGDLMRSIHAEYVGNIKGGGIWAVVADDESAVFVEFGTLGSLGEKKRISISVAGRCSVELRKWFKHHSVGKWSIWMVLQRR